MGSVLKQNGTGELEKALFEDMSSMLEIGKCCLLSYTNKTNESNDIIGGVDTYILFTFRKELKCSSTDNCQKASKF